MKQLLPAVHRSLGRLNYDKAFLRVFESSSIRISDETIEASQFSMVIFEHEASAQIWEGQTCTKCSVISGSWVQSLQKTPLAAETTGGEILVAF